MFRGDGIAPSAVMRSADPFRLRGRPSGFTGSLCDLSIVGILLGFPAIRLEAMAMGLADILIASGLAVVTCAKTCEDHLISFWPMLREGRGGKSSSSAVDCPVSSSAVDSNETPCAVDSTKSSSAVDRTESSSAMDRIESSSAADRTE